MVNPSYLGNPTMLFMKSWLLTQQTQILRQLKIVKIILSKVEKKNISIRVATSAERY